MIRHFLLICWLSSAVLANVLHEIQNSEHSIVQRHTDYLDGRSVPCGASMALYSGNTVTLQSPGYPYRYCYNCNCQWAFGSRNANDRLRLTCQDFELENSRDCTRDYMAVETSSGYTQRFCGYTGTLNIESSGRMRIMFTSNSYYSYRGFSCSLTVTSGTGMTTQTTPSTAAPIVTPPTVPQCKCGQQQGKRKKRSSNLPVWPLNSKDDGNTQNTTGNQTEKRGVAFHRLWQNRKSNNLHPLRNRNGIRVVGGTDAEINEFPWMVLITYVGRDVSRCGGSIINNRYIITAGHCLLSPVPPFSPFDSSDLKIYLGEHDRSTSTETTETILVKAGRLIVHEEFDSATLFNDIGLIELQEPLNLENTIYIAPACPPDQNDLYEDREAVVAGWGFTESPNSGPSNADILKKAVVKINNNNDCQAKYTMATEQITENMLCALGSSNEDACVNDSGGPLVVKEGGSWVVVGLVSWGPSDGSCGGTDGKPGVYTRVGKYLDWIGSKINKASTCPPIATPRNSLRNSFGIY